MFDIGFGELLALAVIALFVVGPDRLPSAAAQAGRVLRELRAMATGARRELTEHLELDPELAKLDLSSLDPRAIVRKTLLEDDEEPRSANGSVVAARPARTTESAPSPGPAANGDRPPYDPDAT